MKVYRTSNYDEMCRKAAWLISAQMILCPKSVLGMATGSTPEGVYKELADSHARGDLDFSDIITFNLDEYCGLPGSDPQSYRYYMNYHLFSKVNILPENTHVPLGTAEDMEKECEKYERMIEAAGGIDLQLLGIGNNGHIGFNEPAPVFEKNTHVVKLDEKTILANSRFFENPDDVPREAVTMGIRTIMLARKILLVISGESKREIMQKALYGPVTPEVPASILQLHPDLTVVWSAS